MQDISAALQRVESVLRRRPQAGIHEDPQALARWERGTRITALHGSGLSVVTDMPVELGGTGDQLSPGWLFRAGLAGCAATCIVLRAADAALELQVLEVCASSRSDACGLFGLADAAGKPVSAAPRELQLRVRIEARAVDSGQLRALVHAGLETSPIYALVRQAAPIDVQIEIGPA